MRRARQGVAEIFAWPAALAAATSVGLTAGLVGEGGWDWIAWAGLALPAIAAIRAR